MRNLCAVASRWSTWRPSLNRTDWQTQRWNEIYVPKKRHINCPPGFRNCPAVDKSLFKIPQKPCRDLTAWRVGEISSRSCLQMLQYRSRKRPSCREAAANLWAAARVFMKSDGRSETAGPVNHRSAAYGPRSPDFMHWTSRWVEEIPTCQSWSKDSGIITVPFQYVCTGRYDKVQDLRRSTPVCGVGMIHRWSQSPGGGTIRIDPTL